jgi:hypothetical protein
MAEIITARGEEMTDNCHMNSWLFWHLFYVLSYITLSNHSIRLPAIVVPGLFSFLWNDDNCTKRDVERICSILPSPFSNRGRISSIILRVKLYQCI